MDKLTLITHLRRRHYQLQDEWVRQAGLLYLASQGHTHESTKGVVPMRLLPGSSLEQELKLRKGDLDGIERQLDELEAEIQRIGAENTKD